MPTIAGLQSDRHGSEVPRETSSQHPPSTWVIYGSQRPTCKDQSALESLCPHSVDCHTNMDPPERPPSQQRPPSIQSQRPQAAHVAKLIARNHSPNVPLMSGGILEERTRLLKETWQERSPEEAAMRPASQQRAPSSSSIHLPVSINVLNVMREGHRFPSIAQLMREGAILRRSVPGGGQRSQTTQLSSSKNKSAWVLDTSFNSNTTRHAHIRDR